MPTTLPSFRAAAAAVFCAFSLSATTAVAKQIEFSSLSNQVNLTSSGQPMDGGFSFELGVFANGFTPTAKNTAQWVENWRPAQHPDGTPARAPYFGATARFAGLFEVADDSAPWTPGAKAYIWGFKPGAEGSEWILCRAGDWLWPAASPFDPELKFWQVSDATPTLGEINPGGTPFLMKSAAVPHASPPTSWQTWLATELAGSTAKGALDDPDGDGVPNLLEYVFGLPPLAAGPAPETPLEIVDGRLQMTVPRIMERSSAELVVEVSTDLVNWHSGAGHTETVSDSRAGMVVRSALPLAAVPRLFMRLRVELKD